jgi:hypothetical protein
VFVVTCSKTVAERYNAPGQAGAVMDRVEVTRNGETDEFSVVLTRGSDIVRCMVTVAAGNMPDQEKRRARFPRPKV